MLNASTQKPASDYMAEIIIKQSEPKLDRYPEQEKAIAYGKKNWERIADDIGPGRTFETEGQKRDYLRRVSSNKDNVPGIPTFLPAEYLSISLSGIRPARECACGGCATARDNYTCPRCGRRVQ
jgi:hypothetical protein